MSHSANARLPFPRVMPCHDASDIEIGFFLGFPASYWGDEYALRTFGPDFETIIVYGKVVQRVSETSFLLKFFGYDPIEEYSYHHVVTIETVEPASYSTLPARPRPALVEGQKRARRETLKAREAKEASLETRKTLQRRSIAASSSAETPTASSSSAVSSTPPPSSASTFFKSSRLAD